MTTIFTAVFYLDFDFREEESVSHPSAEEKTDLQEGAAYFRNCLLFG